MDNSIGFAAYQLDEPTRSLKKFEDQRVKLVLTEFKLLGYLINLLNDCERGHNERRLTFESFSLIFPDFPILLTAQFRLRVAEDCTPVQLFRSFADLFLLQSYLEVFARFQEQAQGRPIGMVVSFDGYRHAMLVHNGIFDTRGTRMIHDVADDVSPHRVTVEPFQTVVRFLAKSNCTPNTPPTIEGITQQPQVRRDMPITPGMVAELGASPALVILAWLRRVLLSTSGYDRAFVRRVSTTERCVVATQDQIVAETG